MVHDLSKVRPSEWFPYANYFYKKDGTQRQHRDETGYYQLYDTGDSKFDYAWLLHQKRNKHHWQWWILPKDDGSLKGLPIPIKYVREMVCDWTGAGLAQGHGRDLELWYQKNKEKMQLHPETRREVETLLQDAQEDV
jgi:hypothetical protein